MAQPDTLRARLRAELDQRLAVARRAEAESKQYETWVDETWRFLAAMPPHMGAHIALHDPADAIRRYEGELQVLQQHTWSDRDKWRYGITCNGCPNSAASWPCPEIRSLAGRLGVSADG